MLQLNTQTEKKSHIYICKFFIIFFFTTSIQKRDRQISENELFTETRVLDVRSWRGMLCWFQSDEEDQGGHEEDSTAADWRKRAKVKVRWLLVELNR